VTIATRQHGRIVVSWTFVRWAVVAMLLILPLAVMQFTDEVTWTRSDFVAAALLLGGAGAIYELAARVLPNVRYRLAMGAMLVAVVLVVWAEGAVGIF
jgi:hypothetical protein